MAGTSATLKDLSHVGMVVPHRISISPHFISWEPTKTRWNLESESEPEEVEALTLPDLLYLQEQIKLSTGVWCLAINLTNELFASLKWKIRKNLLFPGMNNDKHLQSWPRTVLTLLLCDITKVRRIWKSWTS